MIPRGFIVIVKARAFRLRSFGTVGRSATLSRGQARQGTLRHLPAGQSLDLIQLVPFLPAHQ